MSRLLAPGWPLLLALVPLGCSDASRVNAGGSSFIYPVMLQWTRTYEREQNVQIDYQATGSGNGIQQTIARTINFGCTDAFIKDDLLKKAAGIGGEMVHIPLVMGGVVPVYNLPGVEQPLNFTGAILADVYLGRITRWNDPRIAAINPGVALPDEEIVPVSRSDGSGTTAIFTDFLSKNSPEWKEKVKSGTSVSWPRGVGQRGNEGVAGHVLRSHFSIGYVELIYAIQNKIAYGAVETADSAAKNAKHAKAAGSELPASERVFLRASLETVSAAADAVLKDLAESKDPKKQAALAELRYSLTNAPGPKSYPISGTTWAVLYVRQPADAGPRIVAFLRWASQHGGEAQEAARKLGYAPLPKSLSDRVSAMLGRVTFE